MFQLGNRVPAKQLLAALDVSTSAEQYFAPMLDVLQDLAGTNPNSPYSDIGLWVFHRAVVPFPCEQLGGLQPAGTAIMPTLRDLRDRVGSGTAVLDVLHRLLQEAEQPPLAARELVIFTDGEDRCSRRHPDELRCMIERAAANTTICLHLFTNATRSGSRLSFIQKLSVPRILWSVHSHRTNPRGRRSVSLSLTDNHQSTSCPASQRGG